ncbi:hypothetical protein EMPG_10733 [Blastomyces silverae]|uniref:Uncharacterized protein n=1 Tax=Blastomyces silverae TaxID=2060906 RepID=A0A0H1B354_9EURO|nr:hypothetical protein EMPG_10733 [Blastomyces silverae]
MSSGSKNSILVQQDGDKIWTLVDVDASQINDEASDANDSDSNSMVVVSRVSSPLPIQFKELRSMSPPPIQVLWPSTLPWFQFQNAYFTDSTKRKLINEWGFGNLSTAESDSCAVVVGSRNFELSTNNIASINHAATEIAKSMPEAFTGEHSARMKALASGGPLDAKLEAFRLLAYQVSNNLIEDIEEEDGMEEESRFSRIIDMFRDLNLPRRMWAKTFSVEQDQTSTAFAEALFEAAINTGSLDIIQALLETGIDPNQPINGSMTGYVERPIQYAADSRARGIKMATLLLKAGANVDGVTEEHEVPALHRTTDHGSLEMVKLLVDSGADIRCWVRAEYSSDIVSGFTPLTFAAGRSKYVDKAFDNPVADSSDAEEGAETKESETGRIIRYLLSFHKASQDHEILQDALTVAAYHDKIDIVELLLAAGADIDGENSLGFTALETAILQNYETLQTASKIIRLGANPNHLNKLSPLHIAAAKCDARFVQLLVDNEVDVDTSITLVPKRDSPMLSPHFSNRRVANLEATITRLHTPLQFALHRIHDPIFPSRKTDKAAMILLQAGAKLMGGELVQAVDFDSIALVQILLDRGVDINEQSWDGRTALQACLGAGHDSLSAFLLRNGARLNGGELFSAFKAGRQELVDLLLANRATPHDTGPNGESILEGACLSQDLNQLSWAIRHGPRPYDSGALCAAVCSFKKGNDITSIKSLLSERKFNKADKLLEATAVGYAAYCTIWPVLKCLLNLGDLGECIVPLSGYYGYTDLILHYHYRLSEGYKRQFWYSDSMIRCSVFVPAILGRSWETVQSLLDVGYLPDALSLLVAIKKCTSVEVAKLISHGADVNARPHHNLDTPLQLACRLKHVQLVELLLSHGADVNAPAAVNVPTIDHWGEGSNELPPRSALQAAVEHGHLELIDTLLTAGADVNGQLSPDAGATALQLAAAKGYLGIAKQLLELGAEINASRADIKGRTALEAAAEQGRLDMVHFLLENGAETEGGGIWQYHRAIGFARRHGHQTIAWLLEEWREWIFKDYDCDEIEDELLDDEFREDDYGEYWEDGGY